MNDIISEGVCYSKNRVPDELRDSLRMLLDQLSERTPIDFHPNSKDIVRDLVHPALYSYINGKSCFKEGKSKESIAVSQEYEEHDFWGRKYEDSKYQWLPTPFHVSNEGKCSIKDYINNLDREKFPELYTALERLSEAFLPYFEEVWAYAKAMHFWRKDSDDDADEEEVVFEKPQMDFKGQETREVLDF